VSVSLLNAASRRRAPVTLPGYLAGRPPRNKGRRYPPDPPTVEEIVAVMRQAGDGVHGARMRAFIRSSREAGAKLRAGRHLRFVRSPASRRWSATRSLGECKRQRGASTREPRSRPERLAVGRGRYFSAKGRSHRRGVGDAIPPSHLLLDHSRTPLRAPASATSSRSSDTGAKPSRPAASTVMAPHVIEPAVSPEFSACQAGLTATRDARSPSTAS
jgi:hypothetical protein